MSDDSACDIDEVAQGTSVVMLLPMGRGARIQTC